MLTKVLFFLLIFLSGLSTSVFAQSNNQADCVIDELATNDSTFQLFNCDYSQSQIEEERLGFRLYTNLGTLIILSVRTGAEVIMPHPEKSNDMVATSWKVKKAEKLDQMIELTLYNQDTRKTVKIDITF